MRDSTDGCAAYRARNAAGIAKEWDFLFQECIAATGEALRRSLNIGKQSRETPDEGGMQRVEERGCKQVFHR